THLLRKILGRLAENLLLQLQLSDLLAQPAQLLPLVGADLAAVITAAGPGLLSGVDPVPQGLVVHPELTADITQRPARGPDQLHRVFTELLGILRWTWHLDILPQTTVWFQGVRPEGGTSLFWVIMHAAPTCHVNGGVRASGGRCWRRT